MGLGAFMRAAWGMASGTRCAQDRTQGSYGPAGHSRLEIERNGVQPGEGRAEDSA